MPKTIAMNATSFLVEMPDEGGAAAAPPDRPIGAAPATAVALMRRGRS
jgi:hypothetical protein